MSYVNLWPADDKADSKVLLDATAALIQEAAADPNVDTKKLADKVNSIGEPNKNEKVVVRLRSVAEIFAAKPVEINWLAWPFYAPGITGLLDGWPKLSGKTSLLFAAIQASRAKRKFLGRDTQPLRMLYLSEQTEATLAVQLREAGFTGQEPINELAFIPREQWDQPGLTYTELLEYIENHFIVHGDYNASTIDTFHQCAQLDDNNDDNEVLRIAKLSLSITTHYNMAGMLNRHDRKSGGLLGLSGRNSLALTGAVDNVFHLLPIPGAASNRRKLELGGRSLGLLDPLTISRELDGTYIVWDDGSTPANLNEERSQDKESCITLVRDWLIINPDLSPEDTQQQFADRGIFRQIGTVEKYIAEARKKIKVQGKSVA